jgi:hypothetical protein
MGADVRPTAGDDRQITQHIQCHVLSRVQDVQADVFVRRDDGRRPVRPLQEGVERGPVTGRIRRRLGATHDAVHAQAAALLHDQALLHR